MMEKQSEMSLDEVLSSIKQMVINEEPPVLELTDMVSEDGSIVKINDAINDPSLKASKDMSSFLKMAQANGKVNNSPIQDVAVEVDPISEKQNDNNGKEILRQLIIKMAEPLIKEWLSNNLSSIAREIVEEEVKKALER
ncbi:MAG: DUF2497 domain-containing protein [Alphaproteobacteria bacterium]|nr:DUF2497 domain-containing protein [Alphaproteobacteria bacterium]